MKKKGGKADSPKAPQKTKREQYEKDLRVISRFTPEEATRAILSGAGMPKK